MTDPKSLIEYWSERLEIKDQIRLKRVPRRAWDGHRGNHHVIGINAAETTLYASRAPREDEIVHELLHYRFPKLGERTVRALTKSLLY